MQLQYRKPLKSLFSSSKGSYNKPFLYKILATPIDKAAPTGTNIPTELAKEGTNKNNATMNNKGATDIFQFLLI
jgi:hypothetical protein